MERGRVTGYWQLRNISFLQIEAFGVIFERQWQQQRMD